MMDERAFEGVPLVGGELWKEFNTYQSFRFVIQSYRDLEFCKLIYMVSLTFCNRDACSFEVNLGDACLRSS